MKKLSLCATATICFVALACTAHARSANNRSMGTKPADALLSEVHFGRSNPPCFLFEGNAQWLF
jgi:hypothetical protein